MKIIIIFLSTFCFLLLNMSFQIQETDYNDSIYGKYNCKRVFQHLNNAKTNLVTDTTSFIIIVTKNVSDSVINILTQENTFKAKLKNNLIIPLNNESRFYGKISNDSIYFNNSPSKGPFSYKYFGKKENK